MPTIDSLLLVISGDIRKIQNIIPKKDKRILLSLAKQLSSGIFLTENQGNLLVKIFTENLEAVSTIAANVDSVIISNTWSKSFREVKRIKKIYISQDFPNSFVVEFSFNTRLKEKISQVNTHLRGNVMTSGAKYIFTLTEDSLHLVMKAFAKDDFEVDEKLTKFYQEIQEIEKNEKTPFDIFSLTNEKVKTAVEKSLGADYLSDLRLLQDRKIRFQYKNTEKIPEFSLEDKIANRDSRKIFVSTESYALENLLRSLQALDRFPLLVIFDGRDSAKDKTHLDLLQKSVKNLGILEDIGIYFRYNKESDTAKFNQSIADLHYNKDLSDTTVIAAISNNKIPKFMIKTGWKPQTVISFTSNFKLNKSYVYCSDVDLIIYYGANQPLDKEVNVLL
jgi:hypothetical protein